MFVSITSNLCVRVFFSSTILHGGNITQKFHRKFGGSNTKTNKNQHNFMGLETQLIVFGFRLKS